MSNNGAYGYGWPGPRAMGRGGPARECSGSPGLSERRERLTYISVIQQGKQMQVDANASGG